MHAFYPMLVKHGLQNNFLDNSGEENEDSIHECFLGHAERWRRVSLETSYHGGPDRLSIFSHSHLSVRKAKVDVHLSSYFLNSGTSGKAWQLDLSRTQLNPPLLQLGILLIHTMPFAAHHYHGPCELDLLSEFDPCPNILFTAPQRINITLSQMPSVSTCTLEVRSRKMSFSDP